MSGFATMARQAAEMERSFNAPSRTSSTVTSGVSTATRRQVSSLFAKAKKIYEPGGGYMAGTEAAIARGSKRTVASGVQQLASAGLAGTSIVGGLGKKYEEEVGMPTRARATTARLSALSGLLQAEAGVTASLATRYSTSPGAIYKGGGGGGGAVSKVSTRRPSPTTAQPQQPLPPLNLPGIRRLSGRATGNGVQPRMVSRTDPMNVNRAPGTFQYYNI